MYSINLHFVFVTKYRRKALSEDVLAFMKPLFEEALENWDCELIEFGGEADHVHLLISIHPAIDISKLINDLKTVSFARLESALQSICVSFIGSLFYGLALIL